MSQRSLNTRQTRILIALIPTLVSSCNSEQLIPLEQAMIPKPHKAITITIRHYCPQANSRFVDLYATQLSYLIERAQPRMDFDRDGVPDSHDSNVTLNLGYRTKDSNLDGYSDLLIYLSGIPFASQGNLKSCTDREQDTDHDGLSDCEEDFLGTDPKSFDTDGDTIPDTLELRSGLNPLLTEDAELDPDSDGIINADEVRLNTPIAEKNNDEIATYAFKYENLPQFLANPDCTHFTVSNIHLIGVPNGNLIEFAFIEEELNTHHRRFEGTKRVVVPRTTEGGTLWELEYHEL